ncbi:RNase P modulator RnpM [Lactococcus allomyrinae]|uniref:YlxR family protein n=1 Tax=Lactococcus allomyrinae TaxID=2419773 RepID=A0A387BFN5_9LACT|nr:YlxR family protein [Lactococcus allomyrinae]AYF99935.1 YlxR family protein [Lactococcus allomyrinae]
MKQKKIPMRKSLVSNEQFPKRDLLRIAFNKEGMISIDPTGKAHGRGAYIALLNEEATLAKKKRVFDRAFQTKVDDKFYDELITYVEHQVARRELQKTTYSADELPDYD